MRGPAWVRGLVVGAAAAIVVAPSAVCAKSPVEVRFLHAVAGAGPADLVVKEGGGEARIGGSFAHPSGYERARVGRARLELKVRGNPGTAASSRIEMKPGRWTVIAVARKRKVKLFVYHDGGVRPGKAKLRAIHAASEVGRADVMVNGHKVAQVGLGDATSYSALAPGRYDLAVMRPGGRGGALVSAPRTPLAARTASTAVVVGSAGMPARVILLSDAGSTPTAAPATGLGGAKDDGTSPWLLVLAAGLAGGLLGGTAHMLLTKRIRRAR
jgi:hypothetical protein